jgi:hypothetical protein
MYIHKLVSCAVTHFGAFRLKNVGYLECVISRLYNKQGRTYKLKHILGEEAHIRHVSIVLRTCRLREGGVRVVEGRLEGLHLVLIVVLVVSQTLIVNVEGAVGEGPVPDFIIL